MDFTTFSFNELNERLVFYLNSRNFKRAKYALHEIFARIPFHPEIYYQIIGRIYNHINQDMELLKKLLSDYQEEFPEDPAGYLYEYSLIYNLHTLEELRNYWSTFCQKASRSFHFQPSINASSYECKINDHLVKKKGTFPKDESIHLSLVNDIPLPLNTQSSEKKLGTPQIALGKIELNHKNKLSLNATLNGFTEPTEYYFRYGNSKECLEKQTKKQYIPQPLNAVTSDYADNLFHRLLCFGSRCIFHEDKQLPTQISMLIAHPFGKDRNHMDGIGIVDLFMSWTSAAHEQAPVIPVDVTPIFPTDNQTSEILDLRDARFELTYKSADFDAKKFFPVLWIHGRTGEATLPHIADDLAAWALTDHGYNKHILADDEWHNITFDLSAHSSSWSFCGSNVEEMGNGMRRYAYAPIQNILRENTGGNIVIAFIGGDELDTPIGDIEIAKTTLYYRSRSALAPGQKAKLISHTAPENSNVEVITDGSVGLLASSWVGQAPTEFIWELRDAANITGFKIHQFAPAPIAKAEIQISLDNKYFETVWSEKLADSPIEFSEWGKILSRDTPHRLSHSINLTTKSNAQYIKLKLITSQRDAKIGLDAFEVFTENLPPIPDGTPFTCSETIDDFTINQPLYIQCICKTENKTYESDIVEYHSSIPNKPKIISTQIVEQTSTAIVLKARTTSAGSKTTLTITCKNKEHQTLDIKKINVGIWDAPRDTFYSSEKHPHIIDLLLENEQGQRDETRITLSS